MLYDISWCYGAFENQMWNPLLWNYYFHNLFMLSLQNTIYNNWRTETKRGESFNGISRVGKYTNISGQYGWTLTSIGSHAADFTSSNVHTVYNILKPWKWHFIQNDNDTVDILMLGSYFRWQLSHDVVPVQFFLTWFRDRREKLTSRGCDT